MGANTNKGEKMKKLANGSTVILDKSDHMDGRVVLAMWEKGPSHGHEFVVWRVDEKNNAFSGSYHPGNSSGLEQALKIFNKRAYSV